MPPPNLCILFAPVISYYEETDADHHIPVLVLKRGVGGSRVGKNRIFPIDIHHALTEKSKPGKRAEWSSGRTIQVCTLILDKTIPHV